MRETRTFELERECEIYHSISIYLSILSILPSLPSLSILSILSSFLSIDRSIDWSIYLILSIYVFTCLVTPWHDEPENSDEQHHLRGIYFGDTMVYMHSTIWYGCIGWPIGIGREWWLLWGAQLKILKCQKTLGPMSREFDRKIVRVPSQVNSNHRWLRFARIVVVGGSGSPSTFIVRVTWVGQPT